MINCDIDIPQLRSLIAFEPEDSSDKKLSGHVRECETCQQRLADIWRSHNFETLPSTDTARLKQLIVGLVEEKNSLDAVQMTAWQKLEKIVWTPAPVLAAADSQTSDDKLASVAANAISIFFVANCNVDDPGYWRAEIPLPVEVSPESILTVRVKDSRGENVNAGTFSFCGIEREVKDGRVRYSMQELQETVKRQSVSFSYADASPVGGTLELFETPEV
jgi:hypothetical protein